MAAYDGNIINGPPDTRYTNDTGRVLYQFHVSGYNTCGVCYQYSGAVATFWPIPIHVGCALPGTKIIPSGIVAGFRAWYRGDARRLTFADGTTFAVTANHMLLTPTGFAPTSALVPGDNVIDCGLGEMEGRGNPDDDWQPTPIDQIVGTLAISLKMKARSVPVSSEDFHGDGRFCQGNIDVVTSNGFLDDGPDPESPEIGGQDVFGRAYEGLISFPALGHLEPRLLALRDATDGGMGRIRECKAFLWGRLRHAEQHRVTSIADCNVFLQEYRSNRVPRTAESHRYSLLALAREIGVDCFRLVDLGRAKPTPLAPFIPLEDSSPPELSDDWRRRDAMGLRNALGGLSGKVTTNRVVSIDSFHYSGPVYDVQTTSSLYIINNGIVSSNCRCRQSAIPPGKKAEDPFVDFRKEIDALPHDQRVKVVGDSNYKLLDKGVVPWEEVVTHGRVRTLEEVISRNNLTVEQLIKAGVDPNIADRAWRRVHTSGHDLIERQRLDLIERLRKAGLSQDEIVRQISHRILERVNVDPGRGILRQGLADFGRHADDLVKLLITRPPRGTLKPPKPPPRKPPEPKTFDDAMKRIGDMPVGTLEERKARRIAIRELVEFHAKDGPDGTFHGMTDPEHFRTIRYGGIDFHYTGDPVDLINTLDGLVRPGVVIPDRLMKATKDVYLTGQDNNKDAIWRAKYKDFTKSRATGGDGTIVVYGGNTADIGTFTHEAGHNLAIELYGTDKPGGDYARLLRVTPEKPVSAYAANSPAEDFAEAVSLYVEDPAKMKIDFPERFKIIDRLMTDPSYGG